MEKEQEVRSSKEGLQRPPGLEPQILNYYPRSNQLKSNIRGLKGPGDKETQHLPSINFQTHTYALPGHSWVYESNVGPIDGSQTPQQTDPQGLSGSPHKGRLRVSKACDRCRGQKIKCSGTSPCSGCIRHNRSCTYSLNPSPGANKRVKVESLTLENNHNNVDTADTFDPINTKVSKNGSDKSYVTHLEDRVHYLESLLCKNSLSTFKPHIEPQGAETEDMLFLAETSKTRFLRRHQSVLVPELCKAMYANLSDANKKQVTIPRTQYFGWNMSGCNYIPPETLPSLPEFILPKDSGYYLKLFFEEINPLFSILHEVVFREQVEGFQAILNSATAKDHVDIGSRTKETGLFLALLYLVYALAIRFSEFKDPQGPNLQALKLEEKLFKYSYKVIQIFSFEWESFELIQAWLLIALYLRVTHRQTSSNMAIAHAIVMTRGMGLGRSSKRTSLKTPYQNLKAKRIFWSVYTMDRIFGLQVGRYHGLNDMDLDREFPLFDYEAEKDGWLSLTALAMLHLARVGNYIYSSRSDDIEVAKLLQIDDELQKVIDWLDSVGIKELNVFDSDDTNEIDSLPLMRAQVRLHLHDLIMCIHGRILFSVVNLKSGNKGLRMDRVIDAAQGMVCVLKQIEEANLLCTPWYLHLQLSFYPGMAATALINGGVRVGEAKVILEQSIELVTLLSNLTVVDSKGNIVVEQKFNMAKECLWALKMANHMLALRMEEDYKQLKGFGIDHGSSDVNKENFRLLDIDLTKYENNSPDKKLPPRGKRTKRAQEKDLKHLLVHSGVKGELAPRSVVINDNGEEIPLTPGSERNSDTPVKGFTDGSDLLGNLKWFDQWLDFDL